MAQQQVREVPPHQAEKFLKDMGSDPKFERFQKRMTLSSALTVATQEQSKLVLVLALLKVRAKRIIGALAFNKAVAMVFTIAEVAFRVWYALGASIALALAIGIVLWLKLKKTREIIDEKSRALDEVDDAIEVARVAITEIDELASRGIRIIDPATFGSPAVKEKVEA